MAKRYLTELTDEELKNVYWANKALQQEVFDAMMDVAHRRNAEDYLPCWTGGISYAIGYDRGAYFRCTDHAGFIDGLGRAHRNFGLLPDCYDEDIARAEDLLSEDGFSETKEEELDAICGLLARACFREMMDEYEWCFDGGAQEDYFAELAQWKEWYGGCYVYDDLIMYQDISYVKSYA